MPSPDTTAPRPDRFPWITRRPAPEPLPGSVIERFRALPDLSSTVSDVLDEMGLVGVVGASRLRPTLPDGRVIGTAVTVRNVEQRRSASAAAADRDWRMAEVLAIADARPGDVLLIQGVAATSNMGGLMATIAHGRGMAGAVVEGGVRDIAHSRGLGFPIWSSDVSPATGKWRCVTQEINGPVRIAGVPAEAGDLVVADETGVCLVPRAAVTRVLERCEAITAGEAAFETLLADRLSGEALVEALYSLVGHAKPTD